MPSIEFWLLNSGSWLLAPLLSSHHRNRRLQRLLSLHLIFLRCELYDFLELLVKCRWIIETAGETDFFDVVVAEFDEEFAGVGDADFVEVLEIAFAGVEFEVAAEGGFGEVEQAGYLFQRNSFLEMFLGVVEYLVDLFEIGFSHRVVCELNRVEAFEAFFAQQVQDFQHGNNRDHAFAGGDGGEHGEELLLVDFKFQSSAGSLEQVFDGFEFTAIEETLAQEILVKLQAYEIGFFGSLDEGVG